jgi:hypothetical protein
MRFLACATLAAICAAVPAAGDVRALNISSWAGKRVLLITAHPDDIEGFSGGLVAALQRQGNVEFSYLISTNGDKGGMVSCTVIRWLRQ